MQYKEITNLDPSFPNVFPEGSQIFLVDTGWSDVDCFGKKVSETDYDHLKLLGPPISVKFRIPILSNEEWYEEYSKENNFSICCVIKKYGINKKFWETNGHFYIFNQNTNCYLNTYGKDAQNMNPRDYYHTKEEAIKFLRNYIEPKSIQLEEKKDMWQTYIDEVLDNLTTQQKSFTAFEVSETAQSDMKQDGLFERHRNMRQYIHNAMDNVVGYVKSLKDFGLYEAYHFTPTQPTPSTLPTPQTTATYHRYPDARGSITVPKEAILSLGWLPGRRVYAEKANNEIIISTNPSILSTRYTIDRSYNIRPTRHILNNQSRYSVSVENNKIVIK